MVGEEEVDDPHSIEFITQRYLFFDEGKMMGKLEHVSIWKRNCAFDNH